METIPIIDFNTAISTKYAENKNGWKDLALQIREVLGSIGFMQLVNHGIPESISNSVFDSSKQFFSLPETIKSRYNKPKSISIDSYYGYTKPGEEVFGKGHELRESFDWVEGRGIYPDEILSNFSSNINELHEHCKSVAKALYQLLAIGLELEDLDYFVKKNHHWIDPTKFIGLTNIRLAYYPKISKEMKFTSDDVRIGTHTDFNSLTLLFQDETGGLEAKNINGDWVSVQPIQGGLVVNTGDLLEYWTSGIFQATPHRVSIPETELKRESPRYSVAYFSGPDITETVVPLNISKTPKEQERLEKLDKVYSTEPVNAHQHVISKFKAAYAKAD